ncbi:MAG: DUF1501 domain-containing protein [Phycisphaerales bacterium]|nr:DUF1501 domain-containing protein [Phycisphaerales bacterium]
MMNPINRRYFLKTSGVALAYAGVIPALPMSVLGGIKPARVAKSKTLVVIFLRGGADGLNLVVPFGDKPYYDLRKGIAVATPDAKENAAIDLDGFFGLNPRMAALKPLFDDGLAIAAHAVGYDRNTRSHFEEQDTWETGVVGNTINSDGWLNRHLLTSQGAPGAALRAVAIGDSLPRIMHGKASAFAIRGLEDLSMPAPAGAAPDAVTAALEHAYGCKGDHAQHGPPHDEELAGAIELVSRTTGTTLDGITQLRGVTSGEYKPGVEYPKSDLAKKLMQVARLIKADVGLEVAEVDLGGWDTHQNQGNPAQGGGAFGNLAQTLADSLAAFTRDLESAGKADDTLVVTMTDFGRTAAENGTGGTDHGWANCMFLAGGPVKRAAALREEKKVVTRWPGLAPEQLHQKRDLLHTTDFRDVIGEVVSTHLGNANIKAVLPGHEFKGVGLIA